LRRHSKGSRRAKVRALIVGPKEEAIRLADRLRSMGTRFDSTRFDPLGFVETAEGAGNLRDLIRTGAVNCVFIAPGVAAQGILSILRAVREGEAEVRVCTPLPAILSSRISVEPVGGYATICLRPSTLSGPEAVLKRAFDITVATLVLVAVSPL